MPKLWNETIKTHRLEVRDAILETTAALAAKRGLRSVTMSQVAEETGIGRATLYKYFSGVEEILLAWHERQIAHHLEHLANVRDQAFGVGERLRSVLEAYAMMSRQSRGHSNTELAAFLHHGELIAKSEQKLKRMIRDLVADAASSGEVRGDVSPDELASYCLNSLAAARDLPSDAAIKRLVSIILTGLQAKT
jgi:AcrR family transcriptional regulator